MSTIPMRNGTALDACLIVIRVLSVPPAMR